MPKNESNNVPRPWTRWLVVIQLTWIGLAALAMVGSKFSLLSWRPSLLIVAAAVVGMALIGLLALLVLLQSFVRRRRGLGRSCILAVTVSIPPLAVVMFYGLQGTGVPPIHDITTDTENPPLFVAAKTLRTKNDHSTLYAGEEISKLQRQGYPDINPLTSTLTPGDAYNRSLQAAEVLGWQISAQDGAKGRIEATVESLLFGFKDDIVIRVTADGEGSRIDIRSASRVGVSDLGANARRITEFFETFKAADE